MPSHRSPNFSRLKELLPSLPPARTAEEEANPDTPNLTVAVGTDESGRERGTAQSFSEIRHTAAVQQPSQTDAGRSSLSAKPGKVKPLTRPSTFRLAIELQDALKLVADYNRLNMTDIVAEGIWLHLHNFEWPADAEALREKLHLLF